MFVFCKVKDEQFDYLYASIKARSEHYLESKRIEDEYLRARLQQLDLENDLLQGQLRSATKQLNLLTWKTASKSSTFLNIPDDIIYYIITFLSPVSLVTFFILIPPSFLVSSFNFFLFDLFLIE